MQILHNANIYSHSAEQKGRTALVIDDHAPKFGRILAVGSDDEMIDAFGHRATMQDMAGAVILPGLTDSHIHLKYFAESLQKLDLFGLSKAETMARVAQRASESSPGSWILGHGFNQNNWPEGFPSKADLDNVAPLHPVLLTSASLHSAWCNTQALQLANLNINTPDPENGRIGRDEQGIPNGLLFERAEHLVSQFIPQSTQGEIIQSIKLAQKKLWGMGLTGVHDFDRTACFRALQSMQNDGTLGIRVAKTLPLEQLEHYIEAGLQTGFGSHLLWVQGIKVFADGALGPHTAAMFEAYEDDPQNKGMLFMDGEEFYEIAQKATINGLSMAVHAIGDKANHEILKGYAQLREFEKGQRLDPLRHRIEHVQVLHPDDLDAFSRLGIVASMQPIHATADMHMAETYWGDRAKYSYAWKSLQEHGAKLIFGSDAPVDSPNPFEGIHAAVTRQRKDGSPGKEGWQAQEKVDFRTALAAYSTGAAYAAGKENLLGSLETGHLADLIVIDRDPLQCEPETLFETKTMATMLGGDWVWGPFT